MGLTCCLEMFVANYSSHCAAFQEMEDSMLACSDLLLIVIIFVTHYNDYNLSYSWYRPNISRTMKLLISMFLFIQLMHWIGYRYASHWRRNILFQTTNCVTSHFSKNLSQEKKWRNQLHVLQECCKWLLWRSLGSWQTLLRVIFTVHLQLVSTAFCCSYCAVYLYPVYSPDDCCSAQ